MSPTGLTLVGARAYDPTLGRFISVDPVQDTGQPQQWNGYSYANNTPVTSSDPTGMIPDDCKYFDCYGYDVKKGCPGGCGSTENVSWGHKYKKPSTKPKPGKYVPRRGPSPSPRARAAPSPGSARRRPRPRTGRWSTRRTWRE